MKYLPEYDKGGGGQLKKNRQIIIYILAVVLLFGVAVIAIVRGKKQDLPDQFAVFGQTPYVLKNGLVFRYVGETNWELVELSESVKQLIPGQEFCVLFESGKIHYEGSLSIEENMPLTGAFYSDMAQQLLNINKTTIFAGVSNAVTSDAIVLLNDGTVLVQTVDGYQVCELEEKAAAVSGSYILTEMGNLYFREENSIVSQCIYGGQDLVSITTSAFDGLACIGLKEDGSVISFGKGWQRDPYSGMLELIWVELPVADWKDIAWVTQGNHFAVGLTKKGQLLYAGDFTEAVNEAVRKELSTWDQMIAVFAYNTTLYGLKADGSCVSIEIDLYF